MTDKRLDREHETRAATPRKKAWQRPETLPNPAPADGWVYRWIRLSTRGESDPTNVSSKLREGWEPVLAKDHQDIICDETREGRFSENIVVGGLMLCRAPKELADERNAHYQGVADSKMRAVDTDLTGMSDPRMPLYQERKSKVSRFGNGN